MDGTILYSRFEHELRSKEILPLNVLPNTNSFKVPAARVDLTRLRGPIVLTRAVGGCI